MGIGSVGRLDQAEADQEPRLVGEPVEAEIVDFEQGQRFGCGQSSAPREETDEIGADGVLERLGQAMVVCSVSVGVGGLDHERCADATLYERKLMRPGRRDGNWGPPQLERVEAARTRA